MNKQQSSRFLFLTAYRFWLQWLTCSYWLFAVVVLAVVAGLWLLPPYIETWSYKLYPLVVEKKLMGLYSKVNDDPSRVLFVHLCWVFYVGAVAIVVAVMSIRSLRKAKQIALDKAKVAAKKSTLVARSDPELSQRLHQQAQTYVASPAMSTAVFSTADAHHDVTRTLVIDQKPAPTDSSGSVETRYQRLQELGRGAMGTVFLAFDNVLQRKVALKTISALMTDPVAVKQRFFKEARMVAKLNHPGIVQIYDFYEQDGRGFIAMEYVDGRSLDVFIAKDSLNHKQKIQIGRDIAKVMTYAHESGVIHRDLKPGNILLTSDLNVKLTDFGLAKLSGTQETHLGTVMGSPLYMSPEQAEGQPVDGRSDIYAFGVLLYELLTGEPLFNGDTVTQVISQHLTRSVDFDTEAAQVLSKKEKTLLSALLAKQPDRRMQTFTEIVDVLDDM